MKKETKKKLGIAAVSAALILAVGATAGSTLAKYITTAEGTATQATVAKWGYTITANTSNMFGQYYGSSGTVITSDSNSIVAGANAGTNVVAPGTNGSMSLTISGSAEVNAKLTIDMQEFSSIWLTKSDDSSTYSPITWTVGSTAVTAPATNTDSAWAAAFATAIETALSGKITGSATTSGTEISVVIPANTQLTGLDLSFGWAWAFSNGHDAEDTILGGWSTAPNSAYTATTTLNFSISVSIEQVNS